MPYCLYSCSWYCLSFVARSKSAKRFSEMRRELSGLTRPLPLSIPSSRIRSSPWALKSRQCYGRNRSGPGGPGHRRQNAAEAIEEVNLMLPYSNIFCVKRKASQEPLFCGLCPRPASGIRLGRFSVKVSRHGFFFFINIPSAFPHIIRSTCSTPDPIYGISVSVFSWYFHWPDTAFF